jgi:dihydrodipicolinate synthase/N-acetylneuraminate lyase
MFCMTGIIPPLVTPLLDPDTLDIEGLERLIEHVISGGVTGLFLLGSTGEGPSLSYALRERMIRESCRIAASRLPVLVCISDSSTWESVRLACTAANAGASAVVSTPPFYFECSQSDVQRYVAHLTSQLPLPLYLYNMPKLTKVAYAVETVRIAADNPKVAGLKDSSGDMEYFTEAVRAVRHRVDFDVFIGPEQMLAEGLRLGCAGGVSGGANLLPRLFVGIYEAARRGDWTEADRLQAQSRLMASALYTIGDPSSSYLRGIKAAVAATGLCGSAMAPPFVEFSSEESALMRSRMVQLPTMRENY